MLQAACDRDDYGLFQKYTDVIEKRHQPIQLRDLLDFKPAGPGEPLERVQSVNEIRKRFVTPGMSLGALSPEAHGTLNVAMNRIGAKSDSGEGGEDPKRFTPRPNGDNENSAIKQVALGGRGRKLQSECQLSAKSGLVSSASRRIAAMFWRPLIGSKNGSSPNSPMAFENRSSASSSIA